MASKTACNIRVTNVNRLGKRLNNEQMIRSFKKKCEKTNILQDLRSHEYYVSPSLKRRLKSKLARQRSEKENAKRQAYLNKYEK